MAGHVMNYDFGPKRNWRRWVWNRIAENVQDRRDALVVYLPAAEDFDRIEALRRGFRPNNLIGAERCAASCDQLRGAGALTIGGDFFDAVDAVARTRNVAVVYGDLCCGLEPAILVRLELMFGNPHLTNAVFVLNLLRGRDSSSNKLRDMCNRWRDELKSEGVDSLVEGKHRGAMLVEMLYAGLFGSMLRIKFGEEVADGPPMSAIHLAYFRKIQGLLAPQCGFAITSYRSAAHQTFDTVVFRNPFAGLMPDGLPEYGSMLAKHGYFKNTPALARTARSASAVLAHRTMREIGTFPRRNT